MNKTNEQRLIERLEGKVAIYTHCNRTFLYQIEQIFSPQDGYVTLSGNKLLLSGWELEIRPVVETFQTDWASRNLMTIEYQQALDRIQESSAGMARDLFSASRNT